MSMNPKQAVVLAVSLVVIVISAYSIFKPRQDIRKVSAAIAQGVAEVAAEEIARLAGSGAAVVILHGSGSDSESPAMARLPAQLSEAIEKEGLVRLLARESVRAFGSDLSDLPEGAPAPSTAQGLYPQLPYDVFERTVKEHPGVSVVISMIGPPRITRQDAELWRKASVKVVVVMGSGYPRTVEQSLKMGVTQLAILPRSQAEPAGAQLSESPRVWFDKQYQVVTPQTVGQMK